MVSVFTQQGVCRGQIAVTRVNRFILVLICMTAISVMLWILLGYWVTVSGSIDAMSYNSSLGKIFSALSLLISPHFKWQNISFCLALFSFITSIVLLRK